MQTRFFNASGGLTASWKIQMRSYLAHSWLNHGLALKPNKDKTRKFSFHQPISSQIIMIHQAGQSLEEISRENPRSWSWHGWSRLHSPKLTFWWNFSMATSREPTHFPIQIRFKVLGWVVPPTRLFVPNHLRWDVGEICWNFIVFLHPQSCFQIHNN